MRVLMAIAVAVLGGGAPVRFARAEAPPGTAAAPDPAEARSGSLMLRSGTGYVEAVRLGTDVELTVSGPVVRAKVTQAFRNTTAGWVEAVYAYPLPEDGAVDALKMVVGRRVIVGEIKPREEAKAVYETAKSAGQVAGLVEQERPNLFTNSVANIGPGQTVLVQIEYQAPVRIEAGGYSLRVPLTAGPRYNSGLPTAAGRDPVPDRSRLVRPVDDPRDGKINPVSVRVTLQPGFRLGAVESPYHTIVDSEAAGGARTVRLAQGAAPAERDFELRWRAADPAAVQAGLLRERVGDADYLLAYLTPPSAPARTEPPPRETVFVIDNSGSMAGESMAQAKASLDYALSRLRPGDRFNIIRFDDTLQSLFPDTVPADAAHLGRARAFVGSLTAEGGTEMVPALRAALADPRPSDARRLRQVVFLTDGAIGAEAELLEVLGAGRGRSRVFMVGIGSAPNGHLMARAAEIGRGAFTHIGSPDEVQADMGALFRKLENPAATELKAALVGGGDVDWAPSILPDLYAGEPLMLSGRAKDLTGVLRITGMVDGRPWSTDLPLQQARPGAGLSKLWARRRITDVEVERTLLRLDDLSADGQVLDLALAHGLVTALTSLVAIDRTPARPLDAPLRREDLPVNLPAGWNFDALFGAAARDGALPQPPQVLDEAGMVLLPGTATDAQLRMMGGALLLILGLALAAAQRRRGWA
jgi:Ca-activated chloride channel family protein